MVMKNNELLYKAEKFVMSFNNNGCVDCCTNTAYLKKIFADLEWRFTFIFNFATYMLIQQKDESQNEICHLFQNLQFSIINTLNSEYLTLTVYTVYGCKLVTRYDPGLVISVEILSLIRCI